MDGFTGAWLIAWAIFNVLGWVGAASVVAITTPSLPPPIVPTHLTDECASHAVQTGKVLFYVERRGFGYIVPDRTGAHIFVHINALKSTGIETLQEGQPVGYSIASTNGKYHAVNICF